MTQYMLVNGIGVPLAMVITGVGSGGVTGIYPSYPND
jgi:hypothetical protein